MSPLTLTRSRRQSRRRGQAVVEFALILPVFILMLLIAVDFGRAFLGWISLNNAARVGANYAALHPNDSWGAGSDFQTLMDENLGAINCTPNPDPAAPPVFGVTREPGDLVRVNLDCDFTILTPVISNVVGGLVSVSSSAAFPISSGCLADCPTGAPGPPPPAPADNCRTVPIVAGQSVAGARAAWVAAGFLSTEFLPATGSDTRTVEFGLVTGNLAAEDCTGSKAFFASRMTVTLEDLVPETCATGAHVPNLLGVTVSTARSAWTAAGFTGAFLPAGNDARIVIQQVTDPVSQPGDCLEPVTTVTVSHGAAPPPPPPPPCKVPSFINTSSASATGTWTGAGFDAGQIAFSRGGTFTIISQSLVGGTYVTCDAPILVSHKAGNTP